MAASAGPDVSPGLLSRLKAGFSRWRDSRIADPKFQAWATRFPLTRPIANRQGAQLYDLVAGFVYSQILFSAVEIDLFTRLRNGPRSLPDLAQQTGWPEEALRRLLQGAAALDLLSRNRDETYALGPLGAALLGAPGVVEMIRHHHLLYADLADPSALLKGEVESTNLSRYWAYVHGAETHGMEAATAAPYSKLMAASQTMVAAETLACHPMKGIRHLLDIGGGEGAFLSAALNATPGLSGTVFDLPAVADRARTAFEAKGLAARAKAVGGSFLSDDIPQGADAISLIRVLYDHGDETVHALLAKVFHALPAGGHLIISEPMSGGAKPTREGDAYFGLYTAAMTSGKPRSAETHSHNLATAGFINIQTLKPRQRFITRVIRAEKPKRA